MKAQTDVLPILAGTTIVSMDGTNGDLKGAESSVTSPSAAFTIMMNVYLRRSDTNRYMLL